MLANFDGNDGAGMSLLTVFFILRNTGGRLVARQADLRYFV